MLCVHEKKERKERKKERNRERDVKPNKEMIEERGPGRVVVV